MSPEPRCYFGCPGRLNRTLLDLPSHPAPRLCEQHSQDWGIYRGALIAQSNTLDWPADFYPFERKMREQMEKEAQAATAVESRAPGTEIVASEAVIGFWYEVPSGEIERCTGVRNRGRGVQVGFVGLLGSEVDPDEIRWLQGKTSVIVAVEPLPSPAQVRLDIETSPQAQADALAEQGYVEEARIILAEPFPDDPDLQAGGHGMTLREIAELYPQASDLAGLAVREAGALVTQNREMTAEESVSYLAALDRISSPVSTPRHLPFTLPVYHKSLHIDWRTPRALFDSQVRRWGPFWLDAAATAENKLAEYHLGPGAEVEDALSVDWLPTLEIVESCGENVWLNHPYSKRESVCASDCAKPKCGERGYHLERPIASSGDWMTYARDQVVLRGVRRVVCLTKAAVETGWWRDAVRRQPPEAGLFLGGASDPLGGPASQFMDPQYPAATWFEFTWENLIVDVVEIEGRVDFDRGGDDGSAGFPSAIVTFSRRAA
jgi:hypothetical protein